MPSIKNKFAKIKRVTKEAEAKERNSEKKDFQMLKRLLQSHEISNKRLSNQNKEIEIEDSHVETTLGKRSRFTSNKNSESNLIVEK